jgi:hypothetical protein
LQHHDQYSHDPVPRLQSGAPEPALWGRRTSHKVIVASRAFHAASCHSRRPSYRPVTGPVRQDAKAHSPVTGSGGNSLAGPGPPYHSTRGRVALSLRSPARSSVSSSPPRAHGADAHLHAVGRLRPRRRPSRVEPYQRCQYRGRERTRAAASRCVQPTDAHRARRRRMQVHLSPIALRPTPRVPRTARETEANLGI